jgi:hypothetical protein
MCRCPAGASDRRVFREVAVKRTVPAAPDPDAPIGRAGASWRVGAMGLCPQWQPIGVVGWRSADLI